MPKMRVILELGSGNDLHGSDYAKAALRAVQDALHHSSLSFVRSTALRAMTFSDGSPIEIRASSRVVRTRGRYLSPLIAGPPRTRRVAGAFRKRRNVQMISGLPH